MDARIFATVMGLSIVVGGCGFKSDLSLPSSEDRNPLFIPDGQPKMQNAEQAADLATPGTSNEIMIDRVTSEASDGVILIDPVGEMPVINQPMIDQPMSDVVEGTSVPVDASGDGVVVDISELERLLLLEQKRKSQ